MKISFASVKSRLFILFFCSLTAVVVLGLWHIDKFCKMKREQNRSLASLQGEAKNLVWSHYDLRTIRVKDAFFYGK